MHFNDDEFIDYLMFDSLVSEYKSVKQKAIKKIDKQFIDEMDFLIKSKQQGIEIDRKHREILNSCIYPFTQKGSLAKTGYHFIRAAPLMELDIQNMDFLLFKKAERASTAILGECKGTVTKPSKVINEVHERKKAVMDNMDYIRNDYLSLEEKCKLRLEFVIAVPSHESADMMSKVIDMGGHIIIWHAPLTGDPKISMVYPPKKIKIQQESMIHGDKLLKESLRNAPSNRRAFNVFPQGHPVSKLYPLVYTSSPGESGLEINKDTIKSYLIEQDLFYLKEDEIIKITDYIFTLGESIDFLEKLPEGGNYKIKGRGVKKDTIVRSLEEKWISYQIERDKEKRIEEEIKEIQKVFKVKRQKYKRLDEF